MSLAPVEYHPFQPFLPEGAKVLFLGSFPPQPKRWSIDFYYPNFINDFWRICGLAYFGNKDHFIVPGERRFNKEQIIRFCTREGFALYDTASAVRRLKDNASDKFLEVVEPTDLGNLLQRIPICRSVVTTGQKATDVLVAACACPEPPMGGFVQACLAGRTVSFWRMPSTSRAYPLSLEQKTTAYKILFDSLNNELQ